TMGKLERFDCTDSCYLRVKTSRRKNLLNLQPDLTVGISSRESTFTVPTDLSNGAAGLESEQSTNTPSLHVVLLNSGQTWTKPSTSTLPRCAFLSRHSSKRC